ncbi:PAS domain-containing sensor histidine kinase [Flaviaesturariibacter amylovorans]|uniref:Histidine kinase domain-containing protein n=1 Tax=Flaviaesturariibacter amylovorans TaxID=1084520 RepID=A0ABP8HMT4_9BACT
MAFLRRLPPYVWLALIYLGFSTAWILLTDRWVGRWAGGPAAYATLQQLKGLLFVGCSTILLFVTARRLYRHLADRNTEKRDLLRRYRALHRALREGIADHNFATGQTVINEELQQFTGAPGLLLTDFPAFFFRRLHPDDRDRIEAQFNDYLERAGALWQAEFRYGTEGAWRDMIGRACVLREEGSTQPQHLVLALQDVTEERAMQARYYQQQIAFRQEQGRTVVAAQEQERERWAQELHDNVCQLLTVARLSIDQLQPAPADAPFVDKAKAMVTRSLNEIRQLSATIKPPEFGADTLREALEGLAADVQRFRSFQFTLTMSADAEALLDAGHKLLVYRVVQEQLNNIVKYAGARQVRVTLTVAEPQVQLEVADDGQGFDPAHVRTGIGLRNIRSRLQLYAGTLVVDAAPGKGCVLRAQFQAHPPAPSQGEAESGFPYILGYS